MLINFDFWAEINIFADIKSNTYSYVYRAIQKHPVKSLPTA
jgi:hypothetical protein